ncbi:MAG: hypothetical protein IKR73_08130 [Oscillospiraceae bacterium]|nr:hypothetical protein [Oscillospiraceae bacterium]
MQKSLYVIVAAVLVVIVTVLILIFGRGGSGQLIVSQIDGDVTVTHPDSSVEAASENMQLKQGDIVTANDGSACTLLYTISGKEEDYVYVEPVSQIFVTDEFKKKDNEIYLNRGSVIVDGTNAKNSAISIRTDSASFATKNAVVRVAYQLGQDQPASSHVATFAGFSNVQLYNSMGEKIDRDGNLDGKSEPMDKGVGGLVVSTDPPKFEYLNTEIHLADFGASTLKDLLTISSMNELVFSTADIKAAFDAAKPEEPEEATVSETETEHETTEETTVLDTTSETTEDTVDTEETTEEETTETTTERTVETTRETTTAPPQTVATTTTTQKTTVQTTAQTTTKSQEMIPVYIVIGDEIIEQEVPYGGSADIPNDPVIEGKKFVGWDDDFDNITGERMISAIFEEDLQITEPSDQPTQTLQTEDTFDWGTYVEITDPQTAPLPSASHTVTFIVDGQSYTVAVNDGEAAVPPVMPPYIDSSGQSFIAWDQNFQSVTSDMTVYAVYG